MNANSQYIRRRGKAGRLYYKRRFPTDLVDLIGSKMFDKSLGTSDMAKAEQPAARCAMEYLDIVDKARAQANSAKAEAELRRMINQQQADAELLTTKVNEWVWSKVYSDPTDPTGNKPIHDIPESIALFAAENVPAELRDQFETQAKATLSAIPMSRMQTAEVLADRMKPAPVDVADRAREYVTLNDVLSEWEKRSGHPETRLREGRTAVRDFLAVNKVKDIAVDGITYEQVMAYFDLLVTKPAKAGVPGAWYDLPLPELMEKWEERIGDEEYETISLATVAKLGSALTAMVNDQRKRGRVKYNPFSGNVPRPSKRDKRKSRRDSFDEDQARAVFQAPIWTGQHEKVRTREGAHIYRDAWFWILPTLAWTGARLSEIACLHRDNIREEDGIHYLDLCEVHPLQSLKSDASERRVPLHRELIDAGFLKFAQGRNGDWVFPEIMDAEDPKKAIKNISRDYNRGIIHGYCQLPPKLTVHSFRHTFKSALRRLGYADNSEVWYPLLGHEDGRAGAGYGDHPIGPLNEVVQRVQIAGASLAHLKG